MRRNSCFRGYKYQKIQIIELSFRGVSFFYFKKANQSACTAELTRKSDNILYRGVEYIDIHFHQSESGR